MNTAATPFSDAYEEIECRIADIIESAGVKVSVHSSAELVKDKDDDKWLHDVWTVVIDKPASGKSPLMVKYRTGIGHRVSLAALQKQKKQEQLKGYKHPQKFIKANHFCYEVAGARKGTFGDFQWLKVPKVSSVLHSLIMDAQAGSETFEDFCSNYGYDTDSRRALEMYLECQKTSHDLRRFFNGGHMADMEEILRDY